MRMRWLRFHKEDIWTKAKDDEVYDDDQDKNNDEDEDEMK